MGGIMYSQMNMTALNIFEHPLNERMRAFFRVNELFRRAQHFLSASTEYDAQAAILTLLELSEVTGRFDLKRELMKEIERQNASLNALQQTPEVDAHKLADVLKQQKALIHRLHAINGPMGAAIKNHEFLAAIQQRSKIPGGLCEFDLPMLHYWLRLPDDVRRDMLIIWLSPFALINEGIELILNLVRESSIPIAHRAEGGFFQQALAPTMPAQMLRVFLPEDVSYFPEVSAGKQRFSIRFLELELDSEEGRTRQSSENIDFKLASCAL
jgi:cell division protein ZapD